MPQNRLFQIHHVGQLNKTRHASRHCRFYYSKANKHTVYRTVQIKSAYQILTEIVCVARSYRALQNLRVFLILTHLLYTRAVRRRRRRRPNVGVAPAPFSWRVHVMLYTTYMLLAFCNVVCNEAWTLTERTTRACFAIAIDTQTKHGGVKAKVFSCTVLWKWKLMLKVSYGTSLVIWSIKRTVQ